MTCMTVTEAISEARAHANISDMSEACFARLDAARTLADEVERLREIIELLSSGHIRLLYGWDSAAGRYAFWGTARSHPNDMTRADSSWLGPFETAAEAVEAAEAAEEKT